MAKKTKPIALNRWTRFKSYSWSDSLWIEPSLEVVDSYALNNPVNAANMLADFVSIKDASGIKFWLETYGPPSVPLPTAQEILEASNATKWLRDLIANALDYQLYAIAQFAHKVPAQAENLLHHPAVNSLDYWRSLNLLQDHDLMSVRVKDLPADLQTRIAAFDEQFRGITFVELNQDGLLTWLITPGSPPETQRVVSPVIYESKSVFDINDVTFLSRAALKFATEAISLNLHGVRTTLDWTEDSNGEWTMQPDMRATNPWEEMHLELQRMILQRKALHNCKGCGKAITGRSDRKTCSSACRVRILRSKGG